MGQGRDLSRQAGGKAFARSANREAVACFEQALGAVQHLPRSRETIEQAIDLRLALRPALFQLGELARMGDVLREAQTLAEAVGDQARLGRVTAFMAHSFWLRGDHDRAVEAGQRALSIATGIRDFALQASANYYLGEAYHVLGDYHRAADFLRRNVERFEGDLIHERFGMAGPHSVISRAWLVMCLAELGEFPEGIVRGEEGLRIAEAVDQPFSVALASYAVGSLSLRKGDLIRAISLLERALPLCQSVPYYFPWIASALGYAYALSGRVAEALPIQEQAVQQAASERGGPDRPACPRSLP